LIHISALVDQALCESEGYNTALFSSCSETPSTINVTDLIYGKQDRHRNHLLLILEEQAILDRDEKLLLMNSMTDGFYLSEPALSDKLVEKGFNVVNKPKLFRGFAPQVWWASTADAKRLIKEKTTKMERMYVNIRPNQAFTKKSREKLVDVNSGMFGTENCELFFCESSLSLQVTVTTTKQAQSLVNMV